MAREELQAVKGDLCAKVAMLDRVCRGDSEARSSVERLTEEVDKLRMNLERQEALASQRGEVIVELKDKACSQWASRWLSFQCRASRDFPNLEFNIQLSNEVVEESASEAKDDAGVEVLSRVPSRAPLPADLCVPPETSSSALPVGAQPFDPPASVNPGSTSGA